MGLQGDVRTELIQVLSDLDVFASSSVLRDLIREALADEPRGRNLINGFEFANSAKTMARRVVVRPRL